jgi:HemY protein
MTRIIAFLFGILALGAVLAWLADRPGTVSMVWQGYRIETSAMALFIGIILLTAILVVLWQIYRSVMGAPGAISDFFRGRRRMKGYQALSQGMIAVGAGDSSFASGQAKQARKLLADEPLVGLLTAQAAQLAGDTDGAREAFEAMLDNPQTTLLGLHGLFVEAERQGNEAAARRCASEATRRAPSLAWAAEADFKFKLREAVWDEALSALERMESNRLVAKSDARRQRAVLMTAKAMELEDTEPDEALDLALKAHKLVPDFVPAAMVAGRSAGGLGKLSQATSIIEKTWKTGPHPDLADIYAHLRSGDTTQDRLKRVKMLAKKKSGHPESRMAVARAAIDAGDWDSARETLEPLVAREPTRRVCVMMAQIEDTEHGDRGRVREWLARAVHAPRDPAWVADGRISDTWAPVSPVSHTLDGYRWMVPEDESDPASVHVLNALGTMQPDTPMIDVAPDAADETPEAIEAAPLEVSEVEPEASEPTPDSTHDSPNADQATEGKSKSGTASSGSDPVVEAASDSASNADEDQQDDSEATSGSADTGPAEEVTHTPTPASKGLRRAVEAGAVVGDPSPSEADSKVEPNPESKPTASASTNGRRIGPETVAGIAVAAQESVETIETRLMPSQPDDPGPLDDESEQSEADRKKWMGLFN